MHFHLASLLAFALFFAGLVLAGIEPEQAVTSQIAATLLELRGAGLVPTYVPEDVIQLNAALSVKFPDNDDEEVELGSEQDRDDTDRQPTFTLNYTQAVNESAPFRQTRYTLFILDAGAAGVGWPAGDNATARLYQAHNYAVEDDSGELRRNNSDAIVEFTQPELEQGSGEHRILTLVFAQPVNWNLPDNLSTSQNSSADFVLGDWLEQANITTLIAASYFRLDAEEPVTVTMSSTSSVPSASVRSLASSISASLNSSYAQPTTVGGIMPTSTTAAAPDAAAALMGSSAAYTAVFALVVAVVAGGALL